MCGESALRLRHIQDAQCPGAFIQLRGIYQENHFGFKPTQGPDKIFGGAARVEQQHTFGHATDLSLERAHQDDARRIIAAQFIADAEDGHARQRFIWFVRQFRLELRAP